MEKSYNHTLLSDKKQITLHRQKNPQLPLKVKTADFVQIIDFLQAFTKF